MVCPTAPCFEHVRAQNIFGVSPHSGGEASYSKWDTRLSWVFRNGHPVGSQGRHRCRVGDFSEVRPALGEVPETL